MFVGKVLLVLVFLSLQGPPRTAVVGHENMGACLEALRDMEGDPESPKPYAAACLGPWM